MDLDHMIALINANNDDDMSPECNKQSGLPANPALAVAYVPVQSFGETYSEDTGWKNGTIFPELNKPFQG